MLPTGLLDYSAVSHTKAFMANPRKRNPEDTSNSFENSECIDHPEHQMKVKSIR
jgi:hypothetical protein